MQGILTACWVKISGRTEDMNLLPVCTRPYMLEHRSTYVWLEPKFDMYPRSINLVKYACKSRVMDACETRCC